VLWFTVPRQAATPEPKNPDVARAQSPDNGQATGSEPAASLVPDVTRFSTELTGTFSKLTETLTSVKDAASAELALPKLQELDATLDAEKTTAQKLGDAGKATIRELVKSTQAKLRELVDKVLALPGVGEKLKTTVDSIMAKLAELGGERIQQRAVERGGKPIKIERVARSVVRPPSANFVIGAFNACDDSVRYTQSLFGQDPHRTRVGSG
jgi:hypothetical protein